MKATLLLLAPAAILVSCTPTQDPNIAPVAPAANAGNPYGIPDAGAYPPQTAPYQPVDAINPPAAPPLPPIPAPPTFNTPVTPPAPNLNGNVHTIQKGDSLWGISRKYGTSVEALMQANGMEKDKIIEGRTLIIPNR